MALSDLSFKLYTDAGLNTLFSGLYQLTHYTDLSDGNQDFQLWFGSTNAARTLEAASNPSIDNITLTPTEILTDWTALTAYVAGELIEPTVQNGYKYRCTIAGTSDATEPTFPTGGIGSAVTDGTVTWELYQSTHEPSEIKLAATAAGLDGATGGAILSLGTTIAGGVAGAVEVNIRVTNAVINIGKNTGYPELSIDINEVIEQ